MARALYSLVLMLLLPLAPLRLWWRGRREPGYRRYIGERFGFYRFTLNAPVIWIHAVSVGETRAALPLIERLQRQYPGASLLLTHMTASGRDTGRALFGDKVVQSFLPYDIPFAVARFLRHVRPGVGLLMETELWPNLLAATAQRSIPMFLVNARLSSRSAASYAKWPALIEPMLKRLTGIAAQSGEDAARFQALGASTVYVTGNLKFDIQATAQQSELGREFRERFGSDRSIWVAGSTRDGEEQLLLEAMRRHPLPASSLLILVPRHPQRFDAVAELLCAHNVAFVRRSTLGSVPAEIGVVLGDSMGEMSSYYAAADVAFVGGSLLDLGGQNLIEALTMGTPVLVGPSTFNFADGTAMAIEAGAALRVQSAGALIAQLGQLLSDQPRRERMSAEAKYFCEGHVGATLRLTEWLEPQIASRFVREPKAG